MARGEESGKEIDCLVRLEEGHPFQAVAAGGNLNTENRNVTVVKFEIVKGEHNDEDNVGSNFTQYIAWHRKNHCSLDDSVKKPSSLTGRFLLERKYGL